MVVLIVALHLSPTHFLLASAFSSPAILRLGPLQCQNPEQPLCSSALKSTKGLTFRRNASILSKIPNASKRNKRPTGHKVERIIENESYRTPKKLTIAVNILKQGPWPRLFSKNTSANSWNLLEEPIENNNKHP